MAGYPEIKYIAGNIKQHELIKEENSKYKKVIAYAVHTVAPEKGGGSFRQDRFWVSAKFDEKHVCVCVGGGGGRKMEWWNVCYFEETIFVCSYLGRMCNEYADQKERSQVCKQAGYIKDTNFALDACVFHARTCCTREQNCRAILPERLSTQHLLHYKEDNCFFYS